MQSMCLAFPFECMKTRILHSESNSLHWHCIDPPLPRELLNQNNIAVLSDETITVDIEDKIKQYLLETGIYLEREGELLEEHGTKE